MRSEMLVPFSLLWFLWQRMRVYFAHPKMLPVPVVCIGNVTVGGAGKTPVAIATAQMLQARGKKVAFLSRGYGGSLTGPVRVDASAHTANEVGDEPLLLARIAPCYVGKNRLAAAECAIRDGAEILVADDGMQNYSFYKDLTVAVIDGTFGIGNGLVLPAGPLRDRVDKALTRARAVVIIGRAELKVVEQIDKAKLPLFTAHTEPAAPDALPDKEPPYVAFAGIGLPEKFFATLEGLGYTLAHKAAYPDHFPYDARDTKELCALAAKHGAKLITTEKDAVRLPEDFRAEVAVLPIRLCFADAEDFRALLGHYLK